LFTNKIEELIEQAENEFKLISVLDKNKSWEGLEETPVEGQWARF
jgi:hypothetical protein